MPTEPPLPTDTPAPPPLPAAAADPASSPPTRIQAPGIGLDVPVVQMGYKIVDVGGVQAMSWVVPNDAAGFHQGSALPGHAGNTVISGHSDAAARVFLKLVDLQVGDTVIVYVGGDAYPYRVTQRELLQEAGVSLEQRIQNAQWILPTDDERLTLVTCWPYTGASQRLVFVARPLT
jgi:sortase A